MNLGILQQCEQSFTKSVGENFILSNVSPLTAAGEARNSIWAGSKKILQVEKRI